MNYRIFVEKKENFCIEAEDLLKSINRKLNINLTGLRLINIYDLFNISSELLEKSKYTIFGELVTDTVYTSIDLTNKSNFAVEYLPGQFDQRANSAMECLKLLDQNSQVIVKSAHLVVFHEKIDEETITKIKKLHINEIESRVKDLAILELNENVDVKNVSIIDGFIIMNDEQLKDLQSSMHLAMSFQDLKFIKSYFLMEKRNPTETEIRVLDTYWSDHCRHTTFETELTDINIEDSYIKEHIEETLNRYYEMRKEVGRDKKVITLMDMATINRKYAQTKGLLDDLEESEEINACSVYIDVDVDGVIEKWLLMFKNETHNHPTEIEPFGGASTCIGGAIRDPLSGRSYVYQAMRVTGAGDIFAPYANTLPGKLPQEVISKTAAHGYSSYGNQIGLATTYVKEIYHPGYTAKRMEIGAVVGAVKADNLKRETPISGDIVIMFGGATGRDGIGGATGSSKEHTEISLEVCASEVQKGNAPEERKIQRLFRRSEVTKLIKKSNDFGAGGVSVAIGELADGLNIYLDRVPTKYKGLNATEIAISESQERMSVVIDAADEEEFFKYCQEENLNAIVIAEVTDTNRLVMYYNNEKIVDLNRIFINTNGVRQKCNSIINSVKKKDFRKNEIIGATLKEQIINHLQNDNIMIQKGLVEMFDSTIGATTVLMPYGGKTQMTETQVSVQKIPLLNGYTNTASVLSYGYDPYISSISPYHGAIIAVIDSVSKVVSSGASYNNIRFTFQEYFERLNMDSNKWGKPTAALLGAIYAQDKLGLPAIGGKDSMSGTFKELTVPPTLVSFAITTANSNDIISPEFKEIDNYIYLLELPYSKQYIPDLEIAKINYEFLNNLIKEKTVVSCYALGFGGLIEGIAKMSLGNEIGCEIAYKEDLFSKKYGSFIIESKTELSIESKAGISVENLKYLGKTIANILKINDEEISVAEAYIALTRKYEQVYPIYVENKFSQIKKELVNTKNEFIYPYQKVDSVNVYIPIFPGTNCSIDTKRAFMEAGANVVVDVFCNQTAKDIDESIKRMVYNIDKSHIFVLAGGFSSGDEPDGSGKFIANVIKNKLVNEGINRLLKRKCLVLGICNGFQALVKSGLLPYGDTKDLSKDSPTLFKNDINRHISKIATTVVTSNKSPWLSSFQVGEVHKVAISHSEGKFVVNEHLANKLFKHGQVCFQYSNDNGDVSADSCVNPNGSYYAIEGIVSKDGLILGKMGHSERRGNNLYKNIGGNKNQDIFSNAISYFKKGKK